jgi:chemotaxis protein MotB
MARKREHAHADERWLLTYADMITLLMALFMVLFSIAVINKGKFDQLARSLRESFNGPLSAGGNGPLSPGSTNPTLQTLSALNDAAAAIPAQGTIKHVNSKAAAQVLTAATAQDHSLQAAKQAIDRAVAAMHMPGAVAAQVTTSGLVVRLVTDRVVFDVGSAQIRSQVMPLLGVVATAVNSVGANPVRVNGYTDAIPYAGNPHGNEVLSTERADSVLFYLEDHGFSVARHQDTAAGGFGDRNPVIQNDPVTGAGPLNRRVEVIVQRVGAATGQAR